MQKRNMKRRILSMFFSSALFCSIIGANMDAVSAKDIGEKNNTQKDACDAVFNNTAPAGYTDLLRDTSVFRGGNSKTQWDGDAGWYNNLALDNDSNDFAKPLPYGNTYIDTSKLNWTNPSGFIIDIQDDRFKWISSEPLKDANGNESIPSTDDTGKGLYRGSVSSGQVSSISPLEKAIYYVGELQSYLPNVTDVASDTGYTNVIEPKNGAPYLYRITYLNAVTLPDGTKGNLQLTMEKMQIESSFTTNADNPYVTANGVEYDKAVIQVQGENSLSLSVNIADGDKNMVNPLEFVAITGEEATAIMSDVNASLPANQKLGADWNEEKKLRHAVGGILDLGIKVQDQDGNDVSGTISYAAHDLDLTTAEGIWGRPITKNASGIYDTKFGEGMRIVNGSLSYALTPKYEHDSNRDPDSPPTTQEYGWIEHGPSETEKESPLLITRDTTGAGTGPADGVRFSTSNITNMRDKAGTFHNAIFNATTIRTPQGHQPSSGYLTKKDLNAESFGNNYKKLIYGMMKRDGFANAPTAWNAPAMTTELAYEYLGDASWKTDRNDARASFDTGFAVLLDAYGSKLQWSGSRIIGGGISTTLFDSTMYTYVETTHGTGGGIYLETYDLQDDCKPKMTEGVVTMGRHSDSTVTAVPEDGYRVNRILVGNTNYGKGSSEPGLSNYTEYVIDGNNVIVDGQVVGTFTGSDVTGQEGMKTGVVEVDGFNYDSTGAKATLGEDVKIIIERNADGTVDVTMPDIDDPMHVHVDFGADYYFYKVWIDGEPTTLDMTVAPAGFYPTDVEIPVPTGEIDDEGKQITELVKFDIDGNKYTANGGTYLGQDIAGYEFTLTPNNTIEYVEVDETTGQETLAIRPNVVLEGNSFVHKTDGEVDAEYPITIVNRVADWDSIDAKGFQLNQAAINAGYVEELDSSNTIYPGYNVWKVKYPSEGVEDLQWPALPVEKEPTEANHNATNHVDRNYWFAIEEVPNWSTESYDNTNALVPGVKEDTRYHESNWYQSTKKDHAAAETLVHEEYKNSNAFLSVFENGGEIVNVPSIIVRGQKVWKDEDDKYENRQDIWLHIDLTIDNGDESTTTRKDVLPPQKVAKDASGDALTKTWGMKTSYNAEAGSNVKVVGTMKQVPSNAKLQPDGSYKMGNKIYWVNELKANDANNVPYEYSIRETLDRAGNQPVEKADPNAGLLGYTSDDVAEWTEMKKDTTKIDGADIDRYTGTVTNTLKKVKVTGTKVWDDNNDQDGYRTNIKLVISGLDGVLPDDQVKDVVISKDNNTETVEWTNLPLYQYGNVVRYDVSETDWDEAHYTLNYQGEEDEDGNLTVTLTNVHIPETASISIFKKWDDANNQDGLRKDTAKVLLEGKTASEQQYGSATSQDGTPIVQGTVPTEDGLIITWLNVPVYRNGEKITYKIYEDISGLGGYYTDPTYVDETFDLTNGENKEATITNKETPEVKEITITKVWDDMDNHDNIRPDSVTVQLSKTYRSLKKTTKDVDKEVTVNGQKYTVKKTKDGTDTEYYEIDGKYYRGDKVDEVNGTVTDNEEIVTFDPRDTGEDVMNTKIVDVGDDVYPVQITADGIEYYRVNELYYDLNGNVLTPDDTSFIPSPDNDAYVEEPATIEVGGVTYQIKAGKLAGEERMYIEIDGKYYDAFAGEEEFVVFTPSADDPAVQITVKGDDEYEDKTEVENIVLTEADEWTKTIEVPVNSPVAQKIVYSVDELEVPEGYEKTVTSTEAGKYTVTNKHEVIINPPTAEPDETIDYKGKPQTGTPTFKADPDTLAPGGGENKIERITLLDEDGNEVKTVTVPGEGTYVLNDDGTITFTPEPEFVGKTSGVKVRGYDSNNMTADTTYTPTVIVKVSYVDPLKGETVQGPDDSSVPGGTDITTTYEDTPGEESKNHPGYRFDGWEETIDPDDPSHYIRTAKYTPIHKIVYDPNGGTGEMEEDIYAGDDKSKPHKSNTFTRKGYTFTGFKAYITDPTTGKETPILDANGDPIIFQDSNDMVEYFKDMPGGTQIRMEAQWKRNEYHIHYDPNGGSGTMTSQDFTGEDSEAVSKENTFTRDGYTFKGFLAVTKDGRVLGLFTSPADFMKYLEEQGDGGEVTLIAQWEPISNPGPSPDGKNNGGGSPSKRNGAPNTSDQTNIPLWIGMMFIAIAGILGSLSVLKKKGQE